MLPLLTCEDAGILIEVLWWHAWGVFLGHLGDGVDMFGRRSAAPSDDVDETVGDEARQLTSHELRRFVIFTEGIWETCEKYPMKV